MYSFSFTRHLTEAQTHPSERCLNTSHSERTQDFLNTLISLLSTIMPAKPISSTSSADAGSDNIKSLITRGRILYLKKRRDVNTEVVKRYDIEEGVLGHPAMILDYNVDKSHIRVCIVSLLHSNRYQSRTNDIQITSFGDCKIGGTLIPMSRSSNYLPLHPTPVACGQTMIRLQNQEELPKPSYINIERSHIAPISLLEVFEQKGIPRDLSLSMESFGLLKRKVEVLARVTPHRFISMTKGSSAKERMEMARAKAQKSKELAEVSKESTVQTQSPATRDIPKVANLSRTPTNNNTKMLLKEDAEDDNAGNDGYPLIKPLVELWRLIVQSPYNTWGRWNDAQ